MQKHNIKSSLEYSSTPTGDRAGLFHGVTTATQEKCEDKPRRKIENVLHRLKQIPLGLYSYIASNGGMNLLRCSRTLRTSAIISAFALILLATATVVPIYNNISITEAASSYTSSSLSMNVTKSTASVDLSAIRDNGSFASSVNPIAFNITTTNYTGYTLSLKNTKSAKTLVNSTNSNYTLDSITSSVSESAFSADTASAATNYNGKWGYKPSKYNSSNNSNYLSLPTTSGSTLDTTTAANSSANSYTIGIGARANYETAAGTYTGTYTLVAIANNVPYTINYNGNVGTSGDTVGSLPSNTTSTTSEQYITISSNTPTRTGYTFAGWCTNHTTTNPTTTLTNGSTTCPTSATTLSASGRFYINQTTNNLTTLYAIWTRKNTTYTLSYNANNGSGAPTSQSNTNNNGSYTFTLNTSTIPTRSGYNFLGYATSSSATTPTYTYTAGTGTNGANGTFSPSTITLTQPSMSSTSASTTLYAVWEISVVNELKNFTYMQDVTVSACDNTDIGQTATVKDSRDNTDYTIGKLADGKCWLLDNLALDLVANSDNITASNTNATDVELNYLKGSSKGTKNDQYAISSVSNGPSSANNSSYSVPYQYTESKLSTGAEGYAAGRYGIYYNYCAASAGAYCYGNGYSDYGNPSGDAASDICPYGWRMPTSGSGSEYQILDKQYKSSNMLIGALHVPLSGYTNGPATAQGSSGYFWSSVYNSDASMNATIIYATSIVTTTSMGRRQGLSVRCVLDESVKDVKNATYMQDVTAEMVVNTISGTVADLVDSRDSQVYTVAKIHNLLWMTKNLAIGCSSSGSISAKRLTSTHSNVSSAWSTPTALLSAGSSGDTITPRMQCSSTYGAWYNYAAATAGTVTGDDNTKKASYDICPSGWRLPTKDEIDTIGTSDGSIANVSAFDPVYSREYYLGSPTGANIGTWWSSTAHSASGRYLLRYYRSSLYIYTGESSDRSSGTGHSVRCVRAAS